MGNSTIKSSSSSPNPPRKALSSKSIHRCIQQAMGQLSPDNTPDVETLGFTFGVAQQIFLHLSLVDLHRCMLVCKEWRSLIDTCTFWSLYTETHYDFSIKEPHKRSPMSAWKLKSSIRSTSNRIRANKTETFIFRPFPDIWDCDVIVPYALAPPRGPIDVYHNFLEAMEFLRQLRIKVKELQLAHVVETCLLPWFRDRMPTSYEVLSILGVHKDLADSAADAKPLNRQEMRNYYNILKAGYSGQKLNRELYMWFCNKTSNMCLTFDCRTNTADPIPAFIVTKLSPGWIGGMLYAL